MGRAGGLPSSLAFKVGWLAAAFAIVWFNAPAGPGLGRAESLSLGTPSVAAAATLTPVTAAEAPTSRASGAISGTWVATDLSDRSIAEGAGVRIGVLAVADEPIPARVARETGERQIWVYVALKNVGVRDITYTALDLELSDGDSVYSSVEGRRGPGPMLSFGALGPSDAVSGWRLFRVPAAAGPFDLVYSGPPAI